MAPIRTQRGFVRRSSRQISMTSYNEDDLELLYPSDSDSDNTSVGSPSSPIFPAFPSSASFALVISDDVRRIISYSPAAMKYCPEITPACPYAKTTSHSAKRDPGHAPRPPNGFMIFRSNLCANGKSTERKHNVLSQEAGILWARLSEREKEPFESAAQVVKERHAALYPKYQFKPSTVKKEKKTRSGSKAKKGSKTRSQKPRITVTAGPSPSPSFDAPSPQLAFPAPTFAMPPSSQSFAFDFALPQSSSSEAELTTPEFSFTATSQISPMMLPESLIDIDGLAQTLADVCKVEPHDMAADESELIAVSYYPDALPLAMYDVPADVAEYIMAFPPLHEPTAAYSPEATPPPYDTSAPGWSLDSMLPSMEIASLESSADALFDQYINDDFQ